MAGTFCGPPRRWEEHFGAGAVPGNALGLPSSIGECRPSPRSYSELINQPESCKGKKGPSDIGDRGRIPRVRLYAR